MPQHDAPSPRDFETWRAELLATSEIVQDDDQSVSAEEAEARFLRFVELVDGVRGDDPDEVFLALYESLDDREDYGAYQSVLGALARATPERRGRHAVAAVPALLRRAPDMAGDVLGQLAFDRKAAAGFNRACAAHDDARDLTTLAHYIAEEERDGWLSGDRQRGRLQPLPNGRTTSAAGDGVT